MLYIYVCRSIYLSLCMYVCMYIALHYLACFFVCLRCFCFNMLFMCWHVCHSLHLLYTLLTELKRLYDNHKTYKKDSHPHPSTSPHPRTSPHPQEVLGRLPDQCIDIVRIHNTCMRSHNLYEFVQMIWMRTSCMSSYKLYTCFHISYLTFVLYLCTCIYIYIYTLVVHVLYCCALLLSYFLYCSVSPVFLYFCNVCSFGIVLLCCLLLCLLFLCSL